MAFCLSAFTISLKPLDIETMKRLGTRVNLIPVIAKADTMSPADLDDMKDRVRATIAAQNIKVYVPPIDADDQASSQHSKTLIVSQYERAGAIQPMN
jgi:cell division control protein 12